MKSIGKTSYKGRCERLYFRSIPTYHGTSHYLPLFTVSSFPCSKFCKYQRYWIFVLLPFQTLCLVWLGKRVTTLKGAVSLASTQPMHWHEAQQQTVYLVVQCF